MMCQDLMKSDVTCISPESTLEEAAVRMRDEDIGFLPVCDDAGRVLGTLTDRDITIRAFANGETGDQSVEPYMTRSVVGCRPSDDLVYALDLMSQEKVSRILCVSEEGVLEGVISLSDVAQLEDGALASYALRNISDREVRAWMPGTTREDH
jgi:CBS domain-containing protein